MRARKRLTEKYFEIWLGRIRLPGLRTFALGASFSVGENGTWVIHVSFIFGSLYVGWFERQNVTEQIK